MKKFTKLFSLLVVLSVLAYVSMNAQDMKTKVSLWHNGHIIVVAPEAVPAHLAHGDTYVDQTNSFTITIQNANPLYATVTAQLTTVQSGGSDTLIIVTTDAFNQSSLLCVLRLDDTTTTPICVVFPDPTQSTTTTTTPLDNITANHTVFVNYEPQ